MSVSHEEYQDQMEAEARQHLLDTVDEDMFRVSDSTFGFMAQTGISVDDRYAYWPTWYAVGAAMRTVIKNDVDADGLPVYMWTGSGAWWQRASAMSDETLARLAHMEQSHIMSRTRRHTVVLALQSRRSGVKIDTLIAERHAAIAEFEAALTA